jgi:hypothetical protein
LGEGGSPVTIRKILSVGGEGGGMDLVQEVGGKRRFRVISADHTMTFLNDEERDGPVHGDSGWIATWEEALEKFEKWPWPQLFPLHVDRKFADRVLAAIPEVLKRRNLPEDYYRRDRWLMACGKGKE